MKKTDVPQFTPEYTYERLAGILKDATKKAKSGKLTLEDKLYGIAAGYAQDFVDASRANKKPLDLTGRTEDNIFMALLRTCVTNHAQGKTNEENKADMAKKLGYYQLFSVVNSMNCEEKTTEIIVQDGIPGEPRLVIRSLPDSKGKTYTFDPLDAAKETVDKLKILGITKNASLFGKLTPFYQRLTKELVDHLTEE